MKASCASCRANPLQAEVARCPLQLPVTTPAGPEARGEKAGQKPVVELVFIHGLQLGPDDIRAYWTTWLAGDGSRICWPATWLQLAEGFPLAALVFSLNYDANAKKTATTGRFDLYSLGEYLVLNMINERASIGQSDCPVVFVCHNLGGIVAKQIVCTASTRFTQNAKVTTLLRNLKGLYFYATPHLGSKLFEKVCSALSRRNPLRRLQHSPLLNCLAELDDETQRLNDSFMRMKNSPEYIDVWRFFVAEESDDTVVRGKVIPALEYATWKYLGFDDHMIIMETDRFTVCKPKSKDVLSFQALRDFVVDISERFPSTGIQ